jgi:hypothetical protein
MMSHQVTINGLIADAVIEEGLLSFHLRFSTNAEALKEYTQLVDSGSVKIEQKP